MTNSRDNVWMWHAVVTMTGCDKLWWQWLHVTSCYNDWMWQAVVTMTGCDKLCYNDCMWQTVLQWLHVTNCVTMTACDKLCYNDCMWQAGGDSDWGIIQMRVFVISRVNKSWSWRFRQEEPAKCLDSSPQQWTHCQAIFVPNTMSNIWKTHLVVSLAPLMLHKTYVDCE